MMTSPADEEEPQECAAPAQISAPRLLVRPKGAEERTDCILDRPAPKTLKEKEAQYAAARARIFGESSNGAHHGYRGGQNYASNGYGTGGRSRGGGRGGRGGDGGKGGKPRQQQAAAGRDGGGGRRKTEDAADPDYDRNPMLYAPRLAPCNGEPMGRESRYMPPTYDAEFPALGR